MCAGRGVNFYTLHSFYTLRLNRPPYPNLEREQEQTPAPGPALINYIAYQDYNDADRLVFQRCPRPAEGDRAPAGQEVQQVDCRPR